MRSAALLVLLALVTAKGSVFLAGGTTMDLDELVWSLSNRNGSVKLSTHLVG